MSPWVSTALCDSVRPEHVDAVRAFGFSERQARFLVHVLVYSGVFLERQYRTFARIQHGQKTHDFLAKLVRGGFCRAIVPGALHRGRLYHVHHRPLYEAIDEPNNRHRKTTSLGRFVERLMLLDAVLADSTVTWLGTERDKLAYFRALLGERFEPEWYPKIVFGGGANRTTRYFPDKLPIGVPRPGDRRHVLLYLVTSEVPSEFRLFLLRHANLVQALDEWSVRLLVPRRFRKATAVHRYALRDAFTTPLDSDDVRRLDWYFRSRQGQTLEPSPDADLTVEQCARVYGAARFEALRKVWEREGMPALWTAQSHIQRDQMERGHGRVEVAELSHQYLQLTPLVGVS